MKKYIIQNKQLMRSRILDYFLVAFMLCVSGNIYFVAAESNYQIWNILLFVLVFILLTKKKFATQFNSIFVYVILWGVFFFIQSLFVPSNLSSIVFFILKIFIGCGVFVYLGKRFLNIYLNVMVVVALISLVCFSCNYLGIWFSPLVSYGDRNSIIIYTQLQNVIQKTSNVRNSGMFWEPGVFQAYINLAFLPYINNLGTLFNQNKIKSIILIIALITTYSTTGYIVFALMIMFYLLFYRKNNIGKTLLIISATALFLKLFLSLSFLGDKMGISGKSTDELGGNRGKNLIEAFSLIVDKPFLGYGFSTETLKVTNHLNDGVGGFSNGFAAFIFFTGFIGLFIYYSTIIRKMKAQKLASQYIFIIVLIQILILQGEGLATYPFYLGFAYLQYNNKAKRSNFGSKLY